MQSISFIIITNSRPTFIAIYTIGGQAIVLIYNEAYDKHMGGGVPFHDHPCASSADPLWPMLVIPALVNSSDHVILYLHVQVVAPAGLGQLNASQGHAAALRTHGTPSVSLETACRVPP